MIGRSAVGRPWLVGQIGAALQGRIIPDPEPEIMTEIAVEHYEGLLSLYGEQVGIRHARKHLAAYADAASVSGFQVTRAVRTALVTSEEPGTVVSLLRTLYAHRDRVAA
jgi:tRNA-dihydrouridine synthase